MVSFEYQPILLVKYITTSVHLVKVDFTQLLEMLCISNMGLSCPLNEYENGPAGTFIHPANCREGFEPWTSALQGQRSSTELQAHYDYEK